MSRWIRQIALLTVLATSMSCGSTDGRVNVLFIIVDTLSPDRLGCYGNTSIRTPHIDRLAREGVRFETVVAASPVTAPSVATIVTSTYPIFHRLRDNELFTLNPSLPSLATLFRDAGYSTGAFVGSFVLSRSFGFDNGFAHFDDDMSEKMQIYNPAYAAQEGVLEGTQRRANAVTARALRWLENRDEKRPFFCLVHYFDPHLLYDPPPPFNEAYTANPYDGEIAYTDAHIGILLKGLRILGVDDNTLIVFVADHGEGLGEHGEDSHGYFIYDSTMLVPLIFHRPGTIPADRVIKSQVRTVDVMPTVLDMAGISIPETSQGESMAPGVLGSAGIVARDAYMENYHTLYTYGWHELYGIRTPQWKYIRAPRSELFNLPADPTELVDLHEDRGEVARALADQLRDMEARLIEGSAPYAASRAGADPQATRKMRALGYVGSPNRGSGALHEPSPDRADPKDAIEKFNQRQQAQALSEAGRAQLAQGDCPGAIRSMLEAHALAPDNEKIAYNLSLVYERCGDGDRAIGVLVDFLNTHPETPAGTREMIEERITLLRAARE